MRILLVTLLFTLTTGPTLWAQGGGKNRNAGTGQPTGQSQGNGQGNGQGQKQKRTPEEKAAKAADKLTQVLTLTPEVRERLKLGLLPSFQNAEKARALPKGPERRNAMRDAQMSRLQTLKNILGPEKWPQYLVWREDQRIQKYNKRKAAERSGQQPTPAAPEGEEEQDELEDE
jgi:hypothetical protein